MYEIVDGQAREILYDTSMFEFDKAGIDAAVMARARWVLPGFGCNS